ncbi:MAG: ABC transporter ATP-binding protein [Ilumatobacteraceae bacterium]
MTNLDYRAIRKTFGATVALDRLDLEVRDGELITLLGPSGCGKTTALRIAAGFEVPDTGTVHVGGAEVTGTPAHERNMGMVFQSYSLFPNLTVAQNIEFGLRTRKMPKDARRRRVHEMMEMVQLTSMANRYAHQLSGGQQQRVALARALAIKPQVLLLDEPLSALDAKVRSSLRDEIRRLQTELGITTLFVTHDQEEALAISDRICVMSNGRIEQIGTPTEVYRNPATAFVARFVGSMNEFPATTAPGGAVIGGLRVETTVTESMASGSAVSLLVRPEDVHIADEGLPGTVTAVVFQGSTTIVSVRLDVLDLLVKADVGQGGADRLRIGDRVHVGVNARAAVCERP